MRDRTVWGRKEQLGQLLGCDLLPGVAVQKRGHSPSLEGGMAGEQAKCPWLYPHGL